MMNHLQQLQNWMRVHNIDLLLINHNDEFLNEYIAPYAERLQWVVILQDQQDRQ